MVGTRLTNSNGAYDRVITIIFGLDINRYLSKELFNLTGSKDICDILVLETDTIDNMIYMDENVSMQPVINGHKSLIKILLNYNRYRESISDPIQPIGTTSL